MPSPSGSSDAFLVALSDSETVNALLEGAVWGANAGTFTTFLSYSFPGVTSYWDTEDYPSSGSEVSGGYTALGTDYQDAIADVLDLWAGVGKLSFFASSDTSTTVGDLRFAATSWDMDENTLAYAWTPAGTPKGGDVWLNENLLDTLLADPLPGSLGWQTLLHETGHALGLKHPFETLPGNDAVLSAALDSMFWTVMSYNVWEGVANTGDNMSIYPTTPMALDIAAMQYLYGKALHNNTDTFYNYSSDGAYLETLWDTGGTDTITISGNANVVIDLTPGSWSAIGAPVLITGIDPVSETVHIYQSAIIERATAGGGHDAITGNDAANFLRGGAGNDTLLGGKGRDILDGEAGDDSLVGGAGDDLYYTDGNDTLVETANGGIDKAMVMTSAALADFIENGALTGAATATSLSGNGLANILTGNSADNLLTGEGGDDRVLGGSGNDTLAGNAGHDQLTGGGGRDVFLFDGDPLAAGSDRIHDFDGRRDSFQLEGGVYTGLVAGTLAADAFTTGTKARDAEDRIIHDRDSGRLYYDADGRGGLDKVWFAQLDKGVTLAATDIQVA